MPAVDEEKRTLMFPRLSAAQIARVATYARRRSVASGEVLYDQGAPDAGIYVVLSGSLEAAR
ncbi:MAG TPA: cyclic nucleotide-binding domain-containing protein, partial [Polyangiaceae bacterium]|nr:cyclic nucleotide-binding domain-containing protein [Polyangiaceae bacterium]